MDDPMIRSRLGRINGTRPFGALDPKQEPLFFFAYTSLDYCSRNSSAAGGLEMLAQHNNRSLACSMERGQTCAFLARLSGVFNATKDGYSRPTQNVFDDGLAEARSVVVKHETVCSLVVAEFVQTVSIREFAECAELRWIEPVLEFVCDGHECHARNYNTQLRRMAARTAIVKERRDGDGLRW
jgi:hypothetical protein